MTKAIRMLVVDAEAAIRRLLKGTFVRQGYGVSEAETARQTLNVLARIKPNVIILDPALPDQDGIELVPQLKDSGSVVIILSECGQTENKVRALDEGADDYIMKPFDTEEVLARIRTALRHHHQMPQASPTRFGSIEIDLGARVVRKAGVEVHLAPKEYAFLCELLKHPGKVVTHSHLLKAVWGEGHEGNVQYLRVAAQGIRRKLDDPSKPSLIRNEPGVGYRLGYHPE